MRWLILCCFAFFQLSANNFDKIVPSVPEEIASLNADLLVDGFISALSGQIVLSEKDLYVKGAQDLVLERTYIPPQILGRYEDKDKIDRLALAKALLQLETKGWVVLPHLWAGYNRNSSYFQVRDPRGFVLEFEINGNRGFLRTSTYGCSNLHAGEPNSSADIRNIELFVEDDQVKVIWPNGVHRIYFKYFPGVYRLERELLANGKAIRYKYNGNQLEKILATDANGKYVYASITKTGECNYVGSDKSEADLTYEIKEIKGKSKNDGHERLRIKFPVMTRSSNPFYSNTIGYNERSLLTSYDAKSYPISCSYFQIKGVAAKIQTFSTPSGSSSFFYDTPIAGQKGGSTTVTHPNGSQTVYRFDSKLLLSGIENWHDGKLYNQKLFTYDTKQHLSKVEIRDGSNKLLIAKVYECDSFGNPILERREGDFGVFSIRRKFSKNRLISEQRDDGLGYEYAYLKDTHLLTSKITLSNRAPVRKTTYIYDDANNLVEEREEDRTITKYSLYQQGKHLHKVEWKEEKDWGGNLIHKIRYIYDLWGNIKKEEHYGSDGKIAYEIQKTYNSKGNLLNETNPLGQTATYQYDERGRLVKEIPFSQKLTVYRTFDAKGRMVLLKEGNHKTSFVYNASDEIIEKTDYLGLKTNYSYHPIHSKPVFISEDPLCQKIKYDSFGREIQKTDVDEASIRTKFNAYGNPIEIIHPDGGIETFSYASNGLLTEYVDPDGLKTAYSYDSFGRVLSKSIGAYVTSYTYDAYNLIEEKDPLGISTFYKYNLVGQKIEESRAGRCTHFDYDSLGYLSSIERGKRKISYKNDVLGRVIEKSIDDCLKTAYNYDSAGNIDSISQKETIYFYYDAFNRLIEKIDAIGAKTSIKYEEGDHLLTKKIKDAMGNETLETYNAHGLILKKEIPGCLCEEFSYDRNLRLASHDHLIFTYTPGGLKASMCEACQRSTYWTYTPAGKIQTKTKPDGTVLYYEYNSQGDLVNVGSREFEYDERGRLIKGSGFSREIDAFGNITKEEFGNGLVIENIYDDWDRPIIRILPDNSRIEYEYEGPFLKNIVRIGKNGTALYSHRYNEHDAYGRILSETGFFTTSYSYDKAGRRNFQKNPYFEEKIDYDLSGNLIQKGKISYCYDNANQLISEEGKFSIQYDKHYNRIEKNRDEISVDSLNQLQSEAYDLNGNLVRPGFLYDEFDQLSHAGGEHYVYDALGRRIQKGSVSYFYNGEEEIGSFENGKIKELKVQGIEVPISIEISGKYFAPITDVQKTIKFLIDSKTKKVFKQNDCDAFGDGLTASIPYAYMGKRFDEKTGLIYFGKRYYDPSLGRWLTPDPVGTEDHSNFYQYVFNNPFRFQDPNGESVLGFLFGVGQILLGGTIMATGVVFEVATLGGYTLAFGLHESVGLGLLASGCATAVYNVKDISFDRSPVLWKNTNPFDGPVDEDVFVGDSEGNIIPVPEGHILEGTKDGKWIQQKDKDKIQTGTRKDGGGHSKEKDIRGREPHAHVPGVSNPDGTPWLKIY